MSRYAESTSVAADKSRAEIERTLHRYGATSFAYGTDATQAAIEFGMNDRRVRFIIAMPDPEDPEFTLTPTGRERSSAQAYSAWEQATRQRWRALALVVKAKLEAVEAEISEFDDEFMAHIVLPGGGTVSDFMRPQIDEAYLTGKVPTMLALPSGKDR